MSVSHITVNYTDLLSKGGFGAAGAFVILLTPYSRMYSTLAMYTRSHSPAGGSIKINTTDPFSPPVIDLGFLTDPFDIEAIKEGARLAKRFFSGPVWDKYLGAPITPDPDMDPSAFEQHLRTGAVGAWHPTGTAAMSFRNSKKGVVDSELKVKGVIGLRIVDSSVFVGECPYEEYLTKSCVLQPFVPAAHTQAPTYILAERASDLIKSTWAKRDHGA